MDVKVDKGIDLVGAPKYLGATLQVAGGVDNSNGTTAVTYQHVYTKELITVAAGQEYWVYDLPFGSFVPDQPKADLLFTAVTDKTEGATGRISVEVKNEPGALGTIATIIGAQKANIVNLRLDNRDTGFHTNTIDVDVHDVQHLARVIAALRAADAVNDVERV